MTAAEPAPPRSEDVRFRSGGLSLAGTFAAPGSDLPAPAVLMLPGSGQTDRNDNAKPLPIDLFPPLSRALVEHGYATFRYDKRGVGSSDGDYWRSSFDDRLVDATAARGWLRDRPEVDASRVFVLGHSEGALLAIRLAAGPAPVSGVILLAGAARSGEQILTWQARQIADSLTGLNRWVLRILRIDIARSQRKAFARLRASSANVVRIQGRRINAAWMREFLDYDPAIDLAHIEVPVLAITGDRDIQTDPDDLDRMRRLVRGPFEAHRLPGVTHLLRTEAAKRGLRGYREQSRRPVDPRVASAILAWLQAITD